MTPAEIIAVLETECGARIKAKNADGDRPVRRRRARRPVAVCKVLRDHPRLKFDILNCVSGVDYLELDPKKVAKAGFEPHLEVVYHFPASRTSIASW